jgi:hypothetical protein
LPIEYNNINVFFLFLSVVKDGDEEDRRTETPRLGDGMKTQNSLDKNHIKSQTMGDTIYT